MTCDLSYNWVEMAKCIVHVDWLVLCDYVRFYLAVR